MERPATTGSADAPRVDRRAAWLALCGPLVVLGAVASPAFAFGELPPDASCTGSALVASGAITRALSAALRALPLGPLAYRFGLLHALALGALAGATYLALARVLVRAAPPSHRTALALSGAFVTAGYAALHEAAAPVAFSPALAVLACERAWCARRSASARRDALALLFVLAALAGETPALDALVRLPGALVPVLVGGGGALAIGFALRGPAQRTAGGVAATGWLLLGVLALGLAVERARAVDDAAPEHVLDAVLALAPPRALVIAGAEASRALCAAHDELALRPDVLHLPPPWTLTLGSALALERAHPSLRPLLRAQLLAPEPALAELQALAGTRPVLLELEPAIHEHAAAALQPAGLLHRLSTGDVGKTDLRIAAGPADRALGQLALRLSPERTAPELLGWLRARVAADAAHERARGDPARAERLTTLTERWAPRLEP